MKKASILMVFMILFMVFASTTKAFADSVKVSLNIDVSAFDTKSGLSKMMFSNYSDFSGGVWEAYAAEKQWELLSNTGVNTVYIKVMDKYGNTSAASTLNVDLGNQNLFNNITINGGKSDANTSDIAIKLPANSSIKQMRFSEDNINWSDWENYSTDKIYSYTSKGVKNLYISLKTDEGYIFTKEYDSVVNVKELSTHLPKTGSFLDFNLLITSGSIIVLMGIFLVYRSRKSKK